MTPRLGGLLLALGLLAACAHGEPPAGGAAAGPFGALLAFYQGPLDHLSAVRRGDCPMVPSCSEYSRQAVAQHGFAVGWAMTMDRLMRCGRDGLRWAPRVLVDGRVKYLDPLSANDFWWAAAEARPAVPIGPAPQGGRVYDGAGETRRVHVYGPKWNCPPAGCPPVTHGLWDRLRH